MKIPPPPLSGYDLLGVRSPVTPLEVVSCYRDPPLLVALNYPYLCNLRLKIGNLDV